MENTEFNRVLRRVATVLSVVILTLSLVAASTGILLSFYYEPAAGRAYQSLKLISEQVQYGWLFRKAHNVAGNAVIAIALVQIVVLFLGRQFRKSWLSAWISAILFTLMAIGLSWTAMILSWDQEGFWRFNIELGTIEAIPLIGSQLREILTGGGAISTLTIQRLYTIHSYILAIAAIIISIVHLLSILWQEKQMKAQLANSEGDNSQPRNIQGAGTSLAES